MTIKAKVIGLEKLNKALNEVIAQYPVVTRQGLFNVGLRIQRESQEIVPVAVGKLKASAFTRPAKDNPNAVEVGYSAAYAAAVHEKVAMKLKGKPRRKPKGTFYWGPKGEARFLSKIVGEAVRGLRRDLAQYVRGKVRKKTK